MALNHLTLLSERDSERRTYERLLRYAHPYVGRLALGVFFGMVFGGSTGGMLAAFQKNIALIFDPSALTLKRLLLVAALLPLVAALRGIGDFFSKYFVEWVGNRVVMDLRNDIFNHIHDLSLLYFTKSRTGELIAWTTNATNQVQRAVSTVLGDLAREPFVLMAAIGYLIYLDPVLATASLTLFPICIIPVALFGRRVRRASREGQDRMADLVSIVQESVTGVRIVKAFGMEDYEKSRFAHRNRTLFSRLMRVARARASVEPVIVLISFFGLALVMLYAVWSKMTGDQFFTFAAALVVMYQPVKKLTRIHLNIQQSCAAADRVFDVIDEEVDVKDADDAREFSGRVESVTFENVSFAYENDTVLKDVSFTVRAGECVALVGSSGAGKSTLVSLIPRFFDLTSGRILVNGRDIRSLTMKSLRKQIGIVTQETILFNDTVTNNISYGQDEASQEAVIEAAKKAHAHGFIMELDEGYETVIGEQGVRLSGGQRQRLAIARAMLRNPPILILDEATSALDTESERQVQAALNELMANRTVFAIAHRLSTITHADRILVLDKGRIVETGTHKELLDKGGVYKRLHDLQFKDEEQDG